MESTKAQPLHSDAQVAGQDVADEVQEKNVMITQLSKKIAELEASCQEFSQAAEESLQLRSAMKSKEEEMESLRQDIAGLQDLKGTGEESVRSMQIKVSTELLPMPAFLSLNTRSPTRYNQMSRYN